MPGLMPTYLTRNAIQITYKFIMNEENSFYVIQNHLRHDIFALPYIQSFHQANMFPKSHTTSRFQFLLNELSIFASLLVLKVLLYRFRFRFRLRLNLHLCTLLRELVSIFIYFVCECYRPTEDA